MSDLEKAAQRRLNNVLLFLREIHGDRLVETMAVEPLFGFFKIGVGVGEYPRSLTSPYLSFASTVGSYQVADRDVLYVVHDQLLFGYWPRLHFCRVKGVQ